MSGRHATDHQARLFMDWADHIQLKPRRQGPASRSHRLPHQAGSAGRGPGAEGGGDARGLPGSAPHGRVSGADVVSLGSRSGYPAHPGAADPRPEGAARRRQGGHVPAKARTGPEACLPSPVRRGSTSPLPGRSSSTCPVTSGFRNLGREDAGDLTGRCRLPCRHCGREIGDVPALGGSREFADLDACRSFIAGIIGRCNARRAGAVAPPAGHAHHRLRGRRCRFLN